MTSTTRHPVRFVDGGFAALNTDDPALTVTGLQVAWRTSPSRSTRRSRRSPRCPPTPTRLAFVARSEATGGGRHVTTTLWERTVDSMGRLQPGVPDLEADCLRFSAQSI